MLSLFNSSKIFFALSMIISNVGSRYVMNDFNKFSNFVMQNDLLKAIIIFAMFFVATKDVLLSLLLMLVFIFIIKVLLNENSKYNIIPTFVKEQMTNGTFPTTDPPTPLAPRFDDKLTNQSNTEATPYKSSSGFASEPLEIMSNLDSVGFRLNKRFI